MKEVYVYRKHLKKIQNWMLIIGIPVSVLIAVLGVVFEESSLVVVGIFFIGYDLLLYRLYDRFTKAVFILDHEKITLTVKGKIKEEIMYQDITKLDSKSIRYTGGWMLIYGPSKKPLRLMVTIKDVGLMVKRIKTELDLIGLEHTYNEKKLNKFFKTAFYADQSWQRGSYYLPRFFVLLFIQVILAVILAIITASSVTAFLFIVAIIIELIGYIYVEYFMYVKKIRKQTDTMSWEVISYDEKKANKHLKMVLQVGIVATAIATIVAFFI